MTWRNNSWLINSFVKCNFNSFSVNRFLRTSVPIKSTFAQTSCPPRSFTNLIVEPTVQQKKKSRKTASKKLLQKKIIKRHSKVSNPKFCHLDHPPVDPIAFFWTPLTIPYHTRKAQQTPISPTQNLKKHKTLDFF